METIPNRFDRIVAILIQLQSKRLVRAQELADRFGVSLRTIYRDIKSLGSAGVPIIGESGAGYSVMEGYRLPPVMFTREEAGSFVAAEKLMRQFTDETMSAQFAAAMYKIKSVLRTHEKDLMEVLEQQIDIFSSPSGNGHPLPNALQQLVESMLTRKQLALHYQALGKAAFTQRDIEPVGIFHENQFWYIYAWCHLRKDYRQFRMDRIHQLRLIAAPFTREHPNLRELRSRQEKRPTTRVRIKAKKAMVPYLHYGSRYQGFVSEKTMDEWVEMTFESPDPEISFARWLLMFADQVKIIEPASLKSTIRAILHQGLGRLED